MIVLKTSKTLQTFIGLYRKTNAGLKDVLYQIVMNIIFISIMFSVLFYGSIHFIYINYKDLENTTNAVIVLMAGSSGVGCYCAIAVKLKTIQRLYEQLQHLVNESLKYQGFTGFREAEERSHFLIKWFTMFMMLFFTFGTWLGIFGMSLWNLHTGNYDSSKWFLPYRIILLDRLSIFQWYCEYFLQMNSGYAFLLTIASTVTFFGACSYYIDACRKRFKYMFMEIDKNVKNEEKDELIKANILETIIFHNKIMDLFDLIADTYSGAIFFHLIFNIIFFAGAIYQIEMTLGNVNLGVLFNVLCVMEGLSYTFILCYFANSSSYSMAEIANVVYDSIWYNQPPKIQKLFLLIIGRAQKPNIFMGFKIVYCSLESFTRLNRTAATYYIMFRNLSQR